ncbi:ESX-1 secretion-associated protein [Mycobacterium sp. GA-2829]|uniref:ESX-1 secretion-associated protein n=1 Tax=Mycobacterium sp. GA-2829 TaxID=1772283 RepID=UPI0007403114|nr:ESX-1 secretion-associated protein [Mycobacterium sp. GA-2829]KUI30755.1 hypothetical protein AU194_15770 [Mycobacterium sp. GA-2829]
MTGGPLSVRTDGLRQFSQTHTEIASSIAGLLGGGANISGVEATHGQIAFSVQNALSNLLGSRQGALQTTARSGDKIAELLRKAAAAYDKGDEQSAAKLRAAIEAAGGPAAGAGASPASAASGASGAAGALGPLMGQLGQLGQLGQQGSGAVQGLAQGLQQVPQQVMQGVQQIVQAATAAKAEPAGEPGAESGADSERAPVEELPVAERAIPAPTRQV